MKKFINDSKNCRWTAHTNDKMSLVATVIMGVGLVVSIYLEGILVSIAFGATALLGLWGFIRPRECELVLEDGKLHWGWSNKRHKKEIHIDKIVSLGRNGDNDLVSASLFDASKEINIAPYVMSRGNNMETFLDFVEREYPNIEFQGPLKEYRKRDVEQTGAGPSQVRA
ncbi:MAG: hypothetical protein GY854_01385 [Deltaproteobacteria bacterium]|nr:hypothetical protein [Deltaproteobacteria bacterium]